MINNIFIIEKRSKYFPWLLGILAFAAIVTFYQVVTKTPEPPKVVAAKISPFDSVEISGKSAIVYDMAKNQVIYEKNADEPRPLASLVKVMTALTAVDSAPNPPAITITEDDLKPEGDSGLVLNTKWSLKSLIDYSLLVSSNDGASAIAAFENPDKQIFIAKMNSLAQKIGLTHTKFINEHGLDESPEKVGAYGTARDMETLFKYILINYPHLLEATKYPTLPIQDQSGAVYNAVNTNISANQIEGLIASKTGFTDLAGGNLSIAFDAGVERPVIISVLGSTQDGRFVDVLKLVEAARALIQNNDN